MLLIPVVREEDFGVYVCSARNKLGFVEATTELIPGGTITTTRTTTTATDATTTITTCTTCAQLDTNLALLPPPSR